MKIILIATHRKSENLKLANIYDAVIYDLHQNIAINSTPGDQLKNSQRFNLEKKS